MSTMMGSPLPPAMPPEPVARITVVQYHTMIEAGVFDNDVPMELLEGWLVTKMPKKSPHCLSNELVRESLQKVLPSDWHVRTQQPITTDDSEPEPDNSVARGTLRDYAARLPGPKDVQLVVEISDSTLSRDRGIKKRIYARAAIAVYWIVNLVDHCLEVYTDPTGPAETPDYRQSRVYGPEDSIPVILDGQEMGQFQVKHVLP